MHVATVMFGVNEWIIPNININLFGVRYYQQFISDDYLKKKRNKLGSNEKPMVLNIDILLIWQGINVIEEQ